MNCPHCSAQIPDQTDQSSSCPFCGAALSELSSATAPTAAAPLSKRIYLWKEASAPTKLLNKIALGIGALCLILVILAANTVVNGSFTAIPIIGMVVGEEELDYIDEKSEELLDELDEADDDELEAFEEEYDIPVEMLRDAFDPVSLSSMAKIGPAVSAFDEEDATLFNSVITGIVIYAVVIALITALAVVFRKTGLVIFAYIISLPFHVFLSGTVYLTLSAVAYIALSVLLVRLNKEYKQYKKGFAN